MKTVNLSRKSNGQLILADRIDSNWTVEFTTSDANKMLDLLKLKGYENIIVNEYSRSQTKTSCNNVTLKQNQNKLK